MVFLFKQKTAYEMRSSVWSSDVCSSDLLFCYCLLAFCNIFRMLHGLFCCFILSWILAFSSCNCILVKRIETRTDRKSVVSGKSVSVRVDLGGRRIIKQ